MKYAKTEANLQTRIDSFNDSTFFGLIGSMTYLKGNYYLADIKEGHVKVLSENLKLINTLGTKGEGPNEYSAPVSINTSNTYVYVLDDGPSEINIYENMVFIGAINSLLPTNTDFLVKDSTLIGSSLEYDLTTPPIFSYHIGDSSSIARFGNHQKVLNDFNIGKPNKFFIKEVPNGFVAVNENDPSVFLYDYNLNIIDTFTYKDLDYLKNYINVKKERQIKEKRGIDNFVLDVETDKNDIYLLLAGFNDQRKVGEANKILKLKIKQNKITSPELISLSTGTTSETWYLSFCINQNHILTFEANSYELHLFKK